MYNYPDDYDSYQVDDDYDVYAADLCHPACLGLFTLSSTSQVYKNCCASHSNTPAKRSNGPKVAPAGGATGGWFGNNPDLFKGTKTKPIPKESKHSTNQSKGNTKTAGWFGGNLDLFKGKPAKDRRTSKGQSKPTSVQCASPNDPGCNTEKYLAEDPVGQQLSDLQIQDFFCTDPIGAVNSQNWKCLIGWGGIGLVALIVLKKLRV